MSRSATSHSVSATIALLDFLAGLGLSLAPDWVREGLRLTLQGLMDAEVAQAIDAAHYERRESRKAYRNGYRERVWRSEVGEVALHIPKLRSGTYYPGFLRADDARAVDFVRCALVEGASPQALSALAHDLGFAPPCDAEAKALLSALDALAERWHARPLNQPYRTLWLGALPTHGGRVALALGINSAGQAALLDFQVIGEADQDEDWGVFLARLLRRDLRGVRTVLSDRTHESATHGRGPREAAAARLPFATWRYCRSKQLAWVVEQLQASAQVVVAVSDIALEAAAPDEAFSVSVPHAFAAFALAA
jgi:transposase-like protein